MAFTPSTQQLDIFKFVKTPDAGSLNIVARAGCGKSTTLLEIAKIIAGFFKGNTGFLGAFNKAIATELQGKLGNLPGIQAGTMHSLGMYYFRKINSRFKVEGRKMDSIVRKYAPLSTQNHKAIRSAIKSACSFAKQSGFGLKGIDFLDEKQWTRVIEYYDIFEDIAAGATMELPDPLDETNKEPAWVPVPCNMDNFIKACMEAYDESLEQCVAKTNAVIDFDDMILAPLYFSDGKPGEMYDWVLIDEAQDSNEVRRRLAEWVLKPTGRMIVVGDPAQAIYGFAGATNDAMELIRSQRNATELPLSVTYRCPKQVVELANTWVPDIVAHETAPNGYVYEISHREFLRQSFSPTDVILCRFTRPLVGIAKALRERGVECIVEGVNYQGLISLCSKWGENIPLKTMLPKLRDYTDEQYSKWMSKGKEEKAQNAKEKYEMVLDFTEGMPLTSPVFKLLDKIDNLLSYSQDDKRQVLRLCTIHRSKGREWHRVFLIGRDAYMPSQYAKKEWEKQQEDNLAYVAVTRSKDELIEVTVPKDKKKWWEDGEDDTDVINDEGIF